MLWNDVGGILNKTSDIIWSTLNPEMDDWSCNHKESGRREVDPTPTEVDFGSIVWSTGANFRF